MVQLKVFKTLQNCSRTRLLCCLFFGILFSLLLLLTVTISPDGDQCWSKYPMTVRNESAEQILIVDWKREWTNELALSEHSDSHGRCRWTNNRCLLPHAHVVVIHYDQLFHNDLPWKHYRDEKQTFIWFTMESPGNILTHGFDLKRYDNFFNWTMTYRRDADVVTPYGNLQRTVNQLEFGPEVVDEILKRKTKLALWLVSDCTFTSGAETRLRITEELISGGMRIDRIGKCFNNGDLLPRRGDMWAGDEMRSYKFYIAFENSHHCTDYMTEKLWANAYLSGAVPIIWGPRKTDVVAVAPPNSFIHADDFSSHAELAKYILQLDADEEAYRKYLRWRENPEASVESMEEEVRSEYPDLVLSSNQEDLCSALHRRRGERKVIPSIYDEFVAREPSECYQKSSSGGDSQALPESCGHLLSVLLSIAFVLC